MTEKQSRNINFGAVFRTISELISIFTEQAVTFFFNKAALEYNKPNAHEQTELFLIFI
jgi:hypothetical protein